MRYKISYGTEQSGKRQYPAQIAKKRAFVIAAAVLAVILAIQWIGLDRLADLVTPGNRPVTQQAFAEFVSDVKAGEGFREAVTAFCRQILEDGR